MVSILAGFVLCIKKKTKEKTNPWSDYTDISLACFVFFFFLTYQNIGSISFS